MGKRGIASWLAVALFAVAAFAPQVAETQTDIVRVNGVSFPRMLARNTITWRSMARISVRRRLKS